MKVLIVLQIIIANLLIVKSTLALNSNNNASDNKLPNIIIMLMDDMGWGDLGINGNPVKETPNIDQMAREGLLFNNFYTANPLCSPSRASLLTGRLPIRNGFYTDNIQARNAYTPQEIVGGISDWEILIPELLRNVGYKSKIIGKWHLGHRSQFMPLKHGFDQFFGSTNVHFGPYDNVTIPNIAFFRDDLMIGRYFENVVIDEDKRISNLTQWYTEEAIDFIDKHIYENEKNNTSKPFFLYWTPDSLHATTFRSKNYVNKSLKFSSYGDALMEIDDGIGKILNKIKSTPSISTNTFVFFTSDNGAALVSKGDAGSSGPFLCGKQTTFEGGIREPGIAWWNTKIKPGITQQSATIMDLFATIANLTGQKLPSDREYDSISLVPTLFNRTEMKRSIYYYRGNQLMAIRYGSYKAHFWSISNSIEEFNKGIDYCPGQVVPGLTDHKLMNHTDKPVLFHLDRDPGERFPIPFEQEEYTKEIITLEKLFDEHIKSVKPGQPLLNWCDKAVMHWAPQGCKKINMCLPIPESKPYKCYWPH